MKISLSYINSGFFKILLFISLLFLLLTSGYGQAYLQLNSFTANEGLASNHVYDIAEDNKGFLWITTDNGVSRFDGKYFKNFSVKDGLPSNDVLQVAIENDGTVWVNSYKQPPAYFDEVNNRFVSFNSNEKVNEISKTLLFITKIPNGGVRFYNKLGSIIFLRKKLVVCELSINRNYPGALLIEDNQELYLTANPVFQKGKAFLRNFLIWKQDRIIDSILIKEAKWRSRAFTVNNNQIYFFLNDNMFYRISNLHTNPVRYTADSIVIQEAIVGYKFSDKHLCVIGKKNNVFIFDKKTLALLYIVPVKEATNCAYIDRQNNLWVGTLDKGLIYFNKNGINNLPIPSNLVHNNFLSIAANDKGQLFAGNYYGQVLQANGNFFIKHNIPNNYSSFWLRKTICAGEKIITIRDEGVSINFNKSTSLFGRTDQPASVKTAIAISDSIIILGTITGLIQFNINTLASKILNSVPDRILSLVKATENVIYYIGPDGLYKYDCLADFSVYIPVKNQLKAEKLNVAAIASNGNLWISTTGGNLIVLQNDKIIATIPNNTGLPENITCMLPYKDQIWAGSKTGLSILKYTDGNEPFSYTIWNVSKTDGLPSNTVNDLAYYNDTVYAATENGIAGIPVNYKHPEFEIAPELIAVKINQISTAIALDYQLKSNQNNISLEFSGIELTGHFKTLLYAIDKETNFINLTGNTLNLQLNSGKHIVFVKAVDINNKESKTVLKIYFFINTPFYKALWFWSLIAILFTAIILRIYNRRKLAKQKHAFQQQIALEQQRNKITADLHDDIGASLSSLQVNSAVANQLINKDINQARRVLEKIETQSKNLADKIGDIIWSMKPGKDEFMTMSSRIKNFANDILSATNIEYHIQIDKEIDTLIKDITVRKNIVFITKEAINNAVKYSKAAEIRISLKQQEQQLILVIADNGIGFDASKTTGNGIANMRKRAEEIKGRLNVNTTPGHGAAITVVIAVP